MQICRLFCVFCLAFRCMLVMNVFFRYLHCKCAVAAHGLSKDWTLTFVPLNLGWRLETFPQNQPKSTEHQMLVLDEPAPLEHPAVGKPTWPQAAQHKGPGD